MVSAQDSRRTSSSSVASKPSMERRRSSTVEKLSGIWSDVKEYAREHNRASQGAYEALYGLDNVVPSEERRSSASTAGEKLSGVWADVKGYAREHNKSVNGAFEALYGTGAYRVEPNAKKVGFLYQNELKNPWQK